VWNEGLRGRYIRRTPDGVWGTTEEIPIYIVNPSIAVDYEGGVHIVSEQGGGNDISYLYRSPTGEWSEPINVSQSQYTSWFGHVAVDEDGRVYVLWTEGDSRVFYRVKENSWWSESDTIPGTRGHGKPRTKHLFLHSGKKYLLWGDGWFEIYFGYTEGELRDGLEVTKPFDPPGSPYPDVVLRGEDLHVVWSARLDGGNWEIFYDKFSLP